MHSPPPSDVNRLEIRSIIGTRLEDVGGPDPIATVDALLRITAVNQAMADLAGSSPPALMGLGVDLLAGCLGGAVVIPIGECARAA